jgi:hypothetical protein
MGKTKFSKSYEKECSFCKKKYTAFSQKSKYCCDNHRQLFYLRNKTEVKVVPEQVFVDIIKVPRVNLQKKPLQTPMGWINQLPRNREYIETLLMEKKNELEKLIEQFKNEMLSDQWKEYYNKENFM